MLQEILAKGMHMLVHVKNDRGENPIQLATRVGFIYGQVILEEELMCGASECVAVAVGSGDADGAAALFVVDDDPIAIARAKRMKALLEEVMLPQQQQN